MSDGRTVGASWVGFEWAAIRIVPRVHLMEFLNVGVILHARTVDFLEARLEPPWERLAVFAPCLERSVVEAHLDAFVRVCRGEEAAGPLALLPPSERFHWLTAPRSAVVQTSPVHPGRCHDPREALDRLFSEQCGGIDG